MRRPLLTIAGIALGVVVLLLAAVAVVVATLDANTLVAPLAEHLRKATGRELTVRGGADLSVSLEPRLRLRDVTLGAPGGPPIVSAREVAVEIALLPLLRRRIEVTRFTLVEPHIALVTDAAGRGNWAFGPAASATPSDAKLGPALALGVGAVEILRGTLEHRDARSGETTRIEIDRLFVRARDTGAPVHAEFAGRVQGVPVAVEGTAGPLEALVRGTTPAPITLKGEVRGQHVDARAQIVLPDNAPVELRELSVAIGESRIAGTIAIDRTGPRHAYRFALTSPLVRATDLALAPAALVVAGSAREPAAKDARLFPATAIPLDALRGADAAGTLAIGRLVLANGREAADVRATVALRDGRLDVSPLSAAVLGGRVDGAIRVDARAGREPAVALDLDGRAIDFGKVLAAANVRAEVRGGASTIALHVRMQGATPRAWASSVSGTALLDVGPAQLPRVEQGIGRPLAAALDALNPARNRGTPTELHCAVVRLPFERGVARVDRGIAMETASVAVLASGTVDLRDETLDLSLRPTARGLAGVELAQLAGLVRLSGPIASPSARVDPRGTVELVARIGTAAGTGGLSEVARALVRGSGDVSGNECAIARGKVPARPAGASAGPRAAPADPLQDAARLLQGLRGK